MTPASNLSRLELMASLSPSERAQILRSLTNEQAREIEYSWRWNARPNQLLPGTSGAAVQRSDWVFWLALAGRGWGKTRVGSETTRGWARNRNERILMIAPTASDVRDVMIEGPSGLMSCYPPEGPRPIYFPTRHVVHFPSGAIGITRSADEPERLRGPQFTKFWFDELAACQYAAEAWDQVMFGFRLKTPNLQGLITTTPKPIKTVKEIAASLDTVITRGSSYENKMNLSETYFAKVIAPYEGTRLGRQEINAEILEDVPGALWTRKLIDDYRISADQIKWDYIVRVVVAVDPSVTARESSAETGIVVVALTRSRHALVLADRSRRCTVLEWVQIAIEAFYYFRADRIVAEVNNGGDLVEAAIRSVDASIPYKAVRATRGKMLRAEPVSALYEQGRVHHVRSQENPNALAELEQQMVDWTPQSGEKSPDRLDALVWGVHELLIDNAPGNIAVQFNDPYLIG